VTRNKKARGGDREVGREGEEEKEKKKKKRKERSEKTFF